MASGLGRALASLAALAALAGCAPSSSGWQSVGPRAAVVTSPQPLPPHDGRVRIFLGGSIEMGSAEDWQAKLIAALRDQPVLLFNPRRSDWNPAWRPIASEPEFRRQVEWELAALDDSDIIVMYLAPDTQSPVSLLELGLHGRAGKVILFCPEGFWRKGNVDITAQRYGIVQVETFDGLVGAVTSQIERLSFAQRR